MTNYFKYLPVSEQDIDWGLHVLNVGCSRIEKSVCYPSPGHPTGHYFNWEKGRILNEYQIIYVSKGIGTFESASCPQIEIKEGTVLLLFPGEWHRFKPNSGTGWDEYWVGFKGNIIEEIIKKQFLKPRQPILHTGVYPKIIDLFTEIIAHTKNEKSGYQPLISGMIFHLLGEIYAKTKQAAIKDENISEVVINKAMVLMRTNFHTNITIENIATTLQVSYSWFRKAFKAFTGMAPHQYLLQLKIEKAKYLLTFTSKSVKEIAWELSFESSFYFSKIFKIKTGNSPDHYRKLQQNNVE